MAQTAPTVAIEGMTALNRDLRNMGDAAGPIVDMLKTVSMTAAEPVMTRARAAWPVVTGAHAGSLRIVRVKTGATIVEGGKADRLGGTGWLEFGGSLHGGERAGGHTSAGRYLFPAAAALAQQVAERYSTGLQKILDSSSTWTNTTSNPEGITE